MDVIVTGADQFANGLEDVLRQVPKMDPRAVGNIILQAARARAPVDTGKLRASGLSHGMSVRYSAPYSAPIHWGWRDHNIKPNPWLRRATEATEPQWSDAFTDALQVELDRKI